MEEMDLYDDIATRIEVWRFEGCGDRQIFLLTIKEICAHIEKQEARIAALEAERGE